MKIKRLGLLSFCLLMIFGVIESSSVSAQSAQPQQGIGNFDMSKVRQAVNSQESLDGGNAVKIKQKVPDSYAVILLRVIGYLALIIILIFGVSWVVKKAGIVGASKLGGGGAMDIIEVLPFGQNRNAMLVRVMDTVYLLGQTPNNIILLEKIEGQKAIDLIASSKGGTSIVQFKDAFNSFIGKIKKPL